MSWSQWTDMLAQERISFSAAMSDGDLTACPDDGEPLRVGPDGRHEFCGFCGFERLMGLGGAQ